jgi:hypothetical protein
MLIGTSDIRAWLSLSDGDKTANDKLETLAQAVQDFVEVYTNRQLEATYYNNHRDYSIYDGTGQNWIYTKEYPISWINQVFVDSDRVWSSGSLIASADLVVYWDLGKIYSEAGYFTKGHRNVRIDYIAGFGPSTASSYPIPMDIKQVMLEMAVQSFKEGITGVHSVQGMEETKFIQMLSGNTMWRNTLNAYKNFSKRLE